MNLNEREPCANILPTIDGFYSSEYSAIEANLMPLNNCVSRSA